MTYTCSRFYYRHIYRIRSYRFTESVKCRSSTSSSKRRLCKACRRKRVVGLCAPKAIPRSKAGAIAVVNIGKLCCTSYYVHFIIIYIYIKLNIGLSCKGGNFRSSQCERYGQFQVINRWTSPPRTWGNVELLGSKSQWPLAALAPDSDWWFQCAYSICMYMCISIVISLQLQANLSRADWSIRTHILTYDRERLL